MDRRREIAGDSPAVFKGSAGTSGGVDAVRKGSRLLQGERSWKSELNGECMPPRSATRKCACVVLEERPSTEKTRTTSRLIRCALCRGKGSAFGSTCSTHSVRKQEGKGAGDLKSPSKTQWNVMQLLKKFKSILTGSQRIGS